MDEDILEIRVKAVREKIRYSLYKIIGDVIYIPNEVLLVLYEAIVYWVKN